MIKDTIQTITYSLLIFIFAFIAILLTSCTISFQNIDTHGYAQDLVDENQKADADIKTDLTIPVKPL